MTTLTHHLFNQPHPLRWPAWPTGHLNQSDDPLTQSDDPLIHPDDPSDPRRWPLWPTQMTHLTHSDDPLTHSDDPQGVVVYRLTRLLNTQKICCSNLDSNQKNFWHNDVIIWLKSKPCTLFLFNPTFERKLKLENTDPKVL